MMQRTTLLPYLAGIAALLAVYLLPAPARAQEQTVGLFEYDSVAYEGYTLFAPLRWTTTYLIDMYGRLVHSWECSYPPGNSVYLLENGHLLQPARPMSGGGGLIQEIAWDGTVLWDFEYFTSDYRQHHDIEPLPNGNVLLLAWEYKTEAEAIAAGRDPALLGDSELWPEHIVEIEPAGPTSGNIVWEWHLWNHLVQDFDSTKGNYGVVAEHPELVDINFTLNDNDDWIHANAVDYNPELDQIIISSRSLSEFWVIDHSTTSAEAAGHTGGNSGMGGDILYRWGNPQGYDAGTLSDQKLFLPHDAQWIEPGCPGEGNILVFNNGGQHRLYSSVDEIDSPVDSSGHYPQPAPGTAHGPMEALWVYMDDPPGDFYSTIISGAQRLANGNTLICKGVGGDLFEVTSNAEIVWEYINPVNDQGPVMQGDVPGSNRVFRCYRYPPDYPGLQGHDLTPNGPIELNPVTISGTSHSPSTPSANDSIIVTTTIASDSVIAVTELNVDTGNGFFPITLFDDGNHHDGPAGDGVYGAVIPPAPESTVVSYYIYADDIAASSTNDPPNPPSTTYDYMVDILCGDIDGSGAGPNVADLTYLVDYLFRGGPPPPVLGAANVNGQNGVNVADLTYMVDYLFRGGPAPVC